MVIAQCSLEQFQGCSFLSVSVIRSLPCALLSLPPPSFQVMRVSHIGCIQWMWAVKSWWHREKSALMQLHNCFSHAAMMTTKLSFDFFFFQMYQSVLKTALQCRHYYWSHFTDEEVGLRGQLVAHISPSRGEQLEFSPGPSLNFLHKTAQSSLCCPEQPCCQDKMHIAHPQQH